MTATAICLPQQDSRVVAAYRRLGRGLRFLFRVADEVGELVLEPGPAPDSGVSLSFESGCGVMTFTDCTAILSLFGECPVVLADTGNEPGFLVTCDPLPMYSRALSNAASAWC